MIDPVPRLFLDKVGHQPQTWLDALRTATNANTTHAALTGWDAHGDTTSGDATVGGVLHTDGILDVNGTGVSTIAGGLTMAGFLTCNGGARFDGIATFNNHVRAVSRVGIGDLPSTLLTTASLLVDETHALTGSEAQRGILLDYEISGTANSSEHNGIRNTLTGTAGLTGNSTGAWAATRSILNWEDTGTLTGGIGSSISTNALAGTITNGTGMLIQVSPVFGDITNIIGAQIKTGNAIVGTSTTQVGLQIDKHTLTAANPNALWFNGDTDGSGDASAWFGAGKDAAVYYDGTDLIIDPRKIGAGSNVIGGLGFKVDPAAAAYPWHDMLGTIRTRGVGATDPADAVYRNGVKQYQFAVNDECWIEFHIPHDYAPGTDLHVHAHWSHDSGAVTGGTITWTFESTYAKGHNQAAFPATKTVTLSPTASTTQYQHMISEIQMSTSGGSGTEIDTDDVEPDGVILMHITLTANAMTGATPDPFLHFVDIHYQSTNVGTKNKINDFYT